MSQDDKPYGKPMTPEQEFRQKILMYLRDDVINPVMPAVKKYNKQLGTWLKSRDAVLIDGLAAKHTDQILSLINTYVNERANVALLEGVEMGANAAIEAVKDGLKPLDSYGTTIKERVQATLKQSLTNNQEDIE